MSDKNFTNVCLQRTHVKKNNVCVEHWRRKHRLAAVIKVRGGSAPCSLKGAEKKY